jgi:hypothetical protein
MHGRVVVEGSATLVATTLQGKVKRLAPGLVKALYDEPRTSIGEQTQRIRA